jgi:hypothetical protein
MVPNLTTPRVVGGSRNPYVLAELASGKTIDWASMSPLEVRHTLEKTFKMPYEKLFSPQYESPLFHNRRNPRRRQKE